MEKLSTLKGKILAKQIKAEEIFHVIQEDQPDEWRKKRPLAFISGLLVSNSGAAVLLGHHILAMFNNKDLLRAVTLIAAFYLMDLDYPTDWMIPMSLLQRIAFGDNSVHPEFQADTAKALSSLEQYCKDM